MRAVIVEDQTMVRSLLESYFLAEDGESDRRVHSRREAGR